MDKIPEEIEARAKNIILNLLPAKSREQYEKEYQLFKEWEVKNNVGTVSEEVILTYIHEKSKILKPSSLWSKYSMLKATLAIKENVKLEKYLNVIAFLKRNAVDYESKKSKVLSREEINQFLKEASDDIYLMTKVAVVIGICGACRREELHSLQVPDIVDMGNSLIVTLADTKTNKKRVFSVTADGEAINPKEEGCKINYGERGNVSVNFFRHNREHNSCCWHIDFNFLKYHSW